MRLPATLLLLSLLLMGCAELSGLSRDRRPNEQTDQLMCQELMSLFAVGEKIDVQAGRGPEALHVTGRIRDWNAEERHVVLENCVVHAKGTARNHAGLGQKYSMTQRILVDETTGEPTIVVDVTIPIRDMHHIGPLGGASVAPPIFDR